MDFNEFKATPKDRSIFVIRNAIINPMPTNIPIGTDTPKCVVHILCAIKVRIAESIDAIIMAVLNFILPSPSFVYSVRWGFPVIQLKGGPSPPAGGIPVLLTSRLKSPVRAGIEL